MSLDLIITAIGRDALLDAGAPGASSVVVAEIGVTDQVIVPAADMTVLPGELKRVGSVAGVPTGPASLNIVFRDDDEQTYVVRGLGLYLDTGDLFAVCGGADVLIEKSGIASMLVSVDVILTDGVAGDITFGDVSWINPAATTTTQGVVELATVAEALAGADHERAVTPLGLKAAIDALVAGAPGALDTLRELSEALGDDPDFSATVLNGLAARADKVRTVIGGGLATGGGDLSADRVITVTEASEAEALAGVAGDRVITPRRAQTMVDAAVAGVLDQLLAQRRGTISWVASDVAPEGSWECDGRELSRTGADAALFARIGETFGAGDGSTTFNIPDLRGEFVRGWDHGREIDPGRTLGSAQADEFESHSHLVSPPTANGFGGQGRTTTGDEGSSEVITSYSTGLMGGSETRPRNIALMAVIWR